MAGLFNSGTVITSQFLNSVNEGSISPLTYGAKGDLINDDTAAIQAALTYAGGLVKSIIPTKFDLITTKVVLPAGQYKTSAVLTIPEGVIFEGAASSVSILRPSHTGVVVQMGDGSREISQAHISRIGILGNYAGTLGVYQAWSTTTTVGIQMNKCIRSCGLEDIMITAAQVHVQTVGSFQWHIRDSYFLYALTNFVLSDNGTASEMSGNRMDWCEGLYGVQIDGTVNETVGFSLTGGTIQLCWGGAVYLYDVTSATIQDIHFEGNYRSAVDGTTHLFADIDIVTGPNSRGRCFNVHDNFFTPGTSPAVVAYTAIRCNKAKVLETTGNLVRDSHYYRAVDVLSGTVDRLIGIGNDFVGAAGKYAYSDTVTDVFIEEQNGTGVKTISKARLGGLQVVATVSGGDQISDGTRVDYYLSTAAGGRKLTLRDSECSAGAVFMVSKTTADANALTVALIAADGVSASTKTINGAATASTTSAYGSIVIGCDGTNWFVKSKI